MFKQEERPVFQGLESVADSTSVLSLMPYARGDK